MFEKKNNQLLAWDDFLCRMSNNEFCLFVCLLSYILYLKLNWILQPRKQIGYLLMPTCSLSPPIPFHQSYPQSCRRTLTVAPLLLPASPVVHTGILLQPSSSLMLLSQPPIPANQACLLASRPVKQLGKLQSSTPPSSIQTFTGNIHVCIDTSMECVVYTS